MVPALSKASQACRVTCNQPYAQVYSRARSRSGRLTLRSRRPPPAARLGREPVVLIIGLAAQALAARRGRLSSNVRRRSTCSRPFELFVLLALGVALGFLALRLLRPQMERAVANAPPGSFRTPAQRRLHWASLACLLVPLGYIFTAGGSHFFPVLAALVTHAAVMHALRIARLRYVARLLLIPLVSALSAAVGSLVAAWPELGWHSFAQAPWEVLCMASACIGLSTALSICSFPLGFGERAT